MRNRFALMGMIVLLFVSSAFSAEKITGLWKQLDDKTGKPQSIVYLYDYQGKIYGRMIASFDDETTAIKDTIYIKKEKTDKLVGDPAYCGLDYIYALADGGKEYRGGIMDPRSGEEYDCRVWKDGQRLTVRGQLKGLIKLGRNQTWVPASLADLPAGFVLPDPASFIPVIPKAKK